MALRARSLEEIHADLKGSQEFHAHSKNHRLAGLIHELRLCCGSEKAAIEYVQEHFNGYGLSMRQLSNNVKAGKIIRDCGLDEEDTKDILSVLQAKPRAFQTCKFAIDVRAKAREIKRNKKASSMTEQQRSAFDVVTDGLMKRHGIGLALALKVPSNQAFAALLDILKKGLSR